MLYVGYDKELRVWFVDVTGFEQAVERADPDRAIFVVDGRARVYPGGGSEAEANQLKALIEANTVHADPGG